MDGYHDNLLTGACGFFSYTASFFTLRSFMLNLKTSVNELFMVGPIYAGKLKRLGIEAIGDLLLHLPTRYEDFSNISKITDITPDKKISIVGTILDFDNIYTKNGKRIQKGKIADATGEIEIVWYNQIYLKNILKTGLTVSLAGQAKWFGNKLVLESPEYEIIKPSTTQNQPSVSLIHTGRLVPIYPETEGISSKWLRSRIYPILTKFSIQIEEILPLEIINKHHLMGRNEAILNIHFPKTLEKAQEAKRRLAFDELLVLELASEIRKKEFSNKRVRNIWNVDKFKIKIDQFIKKLPFELTSSQKNAWSQILSDLSKKQPMNRLLEGDVGSGKTVVAAIAIYLSCLNGLRSILLAPTEILANQHFQTISDLLSPLGIKVGLITRSTKNKKQNWQNNVLVGTHALLSDDIKLPNLGLVIIDEQQRFGVLQRAIIRQKGDNPHVLILTATPIPRTIALTLYSDLDLTVIDQMPEGRQKVKTWVVKNEKRNAAYAWIRSQILKSKGNEMAFIICPFIEESENMDTVKAAVTEFRSLQQNIFPDFRLGLLHGKLSLKDKNSVLENINKGKLDILVATPVVEVGIDIPTATIIMIEGADRFGLSQLHQLRGRVGRSNLTSYCLLFTNSENETTINRLKILESIFSGPKLAEYDLKLRGMGDMFGRHQHGHFGLRIADLTDLVMIKETKEAAFLLYLNDPSLSQVPLLKQEAQKYTIEKVAPD